MDQAQLGKGKKKNNWDEPNKTNNKKEKGFSLPTLPNFFAHPFLVYFF